MPARKRSPATSRSRPPSATPMGRVELLLEDIRSAHNVGSILRTADAVRAEHVYLAGVSASGDHLGVRKTALGAEATVPWTRVSDAADTARQAKKRGMTLLALEHTDVSIPLDALDASIFPVCLLVGNEVDGLSEALIGLADRAVEIPQYGAKQSLNVAVASGIALYALLATYLGRDLPGDRQRVG